ncbi:MAG: hypothetical protein OEQ16_00835 [Gammaproteobacteria bacterium]|jgi:hypothetical protein|nr:hypothetical protein [Gammaproteobacteria bacterium]
MLLKLRKNLAEANYNALGLEMIVVIAGILIAFQIDRWAEERREREQEYQYLVRLKDDLQFEIGLLRAGIDYAEKRVIAALLLEEATDNPKVAAANPNTFVQAVERVTWRSFPNINGFVYTELQSTGNLSLIRSDALRQGLAEYYSYISLESGIGLDLEIQNEFTRLTAGVLSSTELVDIQEDAFVKRQVEILPERALEITRDIASRQDAVNLLPSIIQHHTFNKGAINVSLDKAKLLISTIGELIEEFDTSHAG